MDAGPGGPRDGADDGATGYPPEPWSLAGEIRTSAYLVPAGDVRGLLEPVLPQGYRPLVVAGRAVVGAVVARYAPGGVLAYDEVMLAVVVRRGPRLALTIPAIWVSSPASAAGGRALWAIPKHLARFRVAGPDDGPVVEVAAAPDPADPGPWQVDGQVDGRPGGDLVACTFRRLLRLPFAVPVPLRTVQRLDGNEVSAGVRALGRPGLGAVRWEFAADGPFAVLRGRRPLFTAELSDLLVGFGVRVRRRSS